MNEILKAAQKGMELIDIQRPEIDMPFYGTKMRIAGFQFGTRLANGYDFGEAEEAMIIINGHEIGKIDILGQFEEGVLVETQEDCFFQKKEN